MNHFAKAGLASSYPMAPVHHIADVTLGKMLQPQPAGSVDVEAPYLRAASITDDGRIDLDGTHNMWFRPVELKSLSLLAGDVVVVEGGSVGRSAILTEDFPDVGFQNSINRVRPGPGLDGRFLNYALGATRSTGFFDVYCDSVSMRHLTSEKLGWLQIPCPSVARQRAIADFLDRETAQIDAMIAAQHELVERLKERRSAVATSLVFRQGVDVPSIRIRHGIVRMDQGWSPQVDSFPVDDPRSEWSILKVGCVNGGTFEPTENKAFPAEMSPRPELAVRAGDVLVSRGNTRELVASASVVPEDYPCLMLSDLLYRLRVDPGRLRPGYLGCALGTRPLRDQIEMRAKGTSHSMQKLTQSDIKELRVPELSLSEQSEVEHRLARSTARMNTMIDAANEAIALMQERRSALISATVTGRIDPSTGAERVLEEALG